MRQFREARKMCGFKLVEAAKSLGISQPALTAWENGSRDPSIEMLLRLAKLYKVSVDFLLGYDSAQESGKTEIPFSQLPLSSGRPVWIEEKGWCLVNFERHCLIFSDGSIEPWTQGYAFFALQPPMTGAHLPDTELLSAGDLKEGCTVWLEPISADAMLREELRGRYRIIGHYAENERGNRFALDTYGAKWLAFRVGQ